jgi:WD40 repeat protein
LELRQRQRKRIEQLGISVLLGTSILFTISLGQGWASLQRQKAAMILERKGVALLRSLRLKFRPLDTLLTALEFGKELNDQLPRDSSLLSLENYPAISPMLALRSSLNNVLEEVRFTVQGESLVPSTDEQREQHLVTFYGDKKSKSRLYDYLTGKEVAQFEGSFSNFSPDGLRFVAFSSSDNRSRLYNFSGRELAQFEGNFVNFSPDRQRLVTSSRRDNKSRLYDLSGKIIAEYQGSFKEFSADKLRLVTTVENENISKIYTLPGRLLAEFPGSVYSIVNRGLDKALGFSPTNQHLLTITNDGYLHLWQLDNGLDDLLARGCARVQVYLQSHPEERRAGFCRK